ncbi:MAG: STAS domain-containing protein [Desulfarculaceae bacterium]|nr:STAS domain-containing protein [Desulfarculaceae bacterium]MCF8072337.1 STAS domain-containing protein [Desulfarculaceae bacterium]MCF8100258.1 STAS domain-containing protein [Desulfarculaceae bacterium]MCF8116169.1 STAS domain-containing protein [Desulfarculaceae bacterium]
MEFKVIPQEDQARIEITGNIDERGAEEMKRRFLDLDLSSYKQIVLDFSGVTFIGSSGIGKLLLLYKNLANHDGEVHIDNLSKDIYTMFKVVKLDKIFKLTPAP